MTTVSFQGERGAYSEAAAFELFADAKTIPCATFADASAAAESGKSECAIIPVENSIAGSVGESYDILSATSLHIIAETYHHIAHCLIGQGSLESADTVYSHPQALAQCRKFIESHGLKTVPTYDTAGSVGMIARLGEGAVCIASKYAAQVYNMPVIEEGIMDRTDNYTRFVVISGEPPASTANSNKTSIIASLPHKQGSLHSLLGVFAGYGINLTRIESRPKSMGSWEYDFFIDLACDATNAVGVLADAEEHGARIKNLGSYLAAPQT